MCITDVAKTKSVIYLDMDNMDRYRQKYPISDMDIDMSDISIYTYLLYIIIMYVLLFDMV